MRIEIELHCAKCGGTNLWIEGQHLKKCSYCDSLLYFEVTQESRFYLPPTIRDADQLFATIVNAKAEKKRSEDMSYYPGTEDKRGPEMITMPTIPLGPYLEKYRRKVEVLQSRLLLVPYWHFQAVLLQCLLARTDRNEREYQLRTIEIDEAVHGYDDIKWNFRDRGLRFGQAKLKEITSDLLSSSAHFPFSDEVDSRLDRIMAAVPSLMPKYDFKLYSLCGRERIPVFRPYWVCRFSCDGIENMLIDACFGSVAGYPEPGETQELLAYNEHPYLQTVPPRIHVLASRCPECGFDVQWSGNEAVRFCSNCSRGLSYQEGSIQNHKYHYAEPETGPHCYLPFWKMRAILADKTQTFASLQHYYRQSFPDRLIAKKTFGDSLWIPAVQPKRLEKGDEFFAALAGDATSRSPRLIEGPVTPPAEIYDATCDNVKAHEIAKCILPSAGGVPASIHKLASVSRMLRETSIEVQDSELALVPYKKDGTDIMISGHRFSLRLLE